MKRPLLITTVAIIAVIITSAAIWSSVNKSIANKDVPLDGDEPDVPKMLQEAKSRFSKEEFLQKRAEGIAIKRGIVKDQPFDPSLRPKAIEKMEKQEELIVEKAKDDPNFALPNWTPIGPAPIPNGQTQTVSTAVSGRTISIAIHPTDENIVYVGTAQGGLYRTTNGGMSWTPLMDSAQSLAIGAIAIAPSNPETVYVGTGEPNFSSDSYFGVGVYRIENASTTATLNGPFNQDAGASDIFSGRAIGEIIVHPTDADTIFVSSTSGVGGFRSVNSVFPSRGIYRSTNATTGTPTFAKLTGLIGNLNVSVRDIAIDPDDANVLIAIPIATGASQGGIYQSTNALNADPTTVTFTQRVVTNSTSTSTLNGELTAFQPALVADATFYAALGISNGRVMRSTDGGTTWTTQITNGYCGGQCFYDIAIAVDPTNVNRLYLGGDPTLIAATSINGGTSFTDNKLGLHVDTHALAVAPSDATNVWLGTDGGIYKSTDSGATWTQQNTAQYFATQFMGIDIHPTDPDFSIGGTQDNGTSIYCPTCATLPFTPWYRADFGDGGFAVIDQNATDNINVRMYHTYFNAVNLQGYGTVSTTATASDGNWAFRGCQVTSATVNGITCSGSINFYAPLERGPGNPNTIYYGSDRLYRSANNGTNHTVVSQNPIQVGVPISTIGIAQTDDNVRMVGLNNGALWGTTTGSSTLVDLDPSNAIPNVAINRVVIDPTNADTAYVALSTFGQDSLYKTTTLSSLVDGIAPTWAAAATGLPQVPINVVVVDPINPANVYAGTDIGVYHSNNGGGTWLPYGQGLPRVAVFGMKITNPLPRQLRIATHGKGMYQAPAALFPTAANVRVTGRVLSESGRSIYGATVIMTNQSGQERSARSNSFGYFSFEEIEAGQTYTFTAKHKQYQFAPRILNAEEDITGFNLVAVK